MPLPSLYTLTGDGAFGLVHDLSIRDLLKETAADVVTLKERDWTLDNRVRTDGKVVHDSLRDIMQEGAASVKYPGATATDEELKLAVDKTGGVTPKTNLGKGKSPNAVVRGASGLDASILRPPARSATLIQPLETHWTPDTPVEIHTITRLGRGANAQVSYAPTDGKVSVTFTGSDGESKKLVGASGDDFDLKQGSPVSVTHVDLKAVEERICHTFDEALKKGADVTLATKNTVLTSVDAPILKRAQEIFEEKYKGAFEAQGLTFQHGLVDDAFAYLLANEWKRGKPLIMLCPDDCYGKQMAEVLAAVKKDGLHYDHTRHAIAVGRLSNGYGDEYGGIHFRPPGDGSLTVTGPDGPMTVTSVAKDGLWLVASHDVAAARTYAHRMINYALSNSIGEKKAERIYFGFDKTSPAEQPLAEAIEQVITDRKDELAAHGISAEVRNPAEIASQVLTHPPETGTILALNNLWGDIMADLFPALANNKASFDSLLLSDKGFMAETGAGGTAGDLLAGKPNKPGSVGMLQTGKMPLNPIAILSGYAHAIRYSGGEAQKRYADQLEQAIDNTLKQGYLTGDLMREGKPQLRQEFVAEGVTPHPVDSRVFVQAVKANLLALQGKTQEAGAARIRLAQMEKKHDFAHPALPDEAEKQVITRYLTLPLSAHTEVSQGGGMAASRAPQARAR